MARKAVTASILAGAALAMLGAAFASKPLYDVFCRVTGFGGTTQRAQAGAPVVLAREITVRFDANVSGLPLDFAPLQRAARLRVGDTGLAFYKVVNRGREPVTAVATYNVTPHKAGPYFTKLECFCFEDMVIAPGASLELPVAFYVDPQIAGDRQADDLSAITLSYTFVAPKGRRQAEALGARTPEG